MHTVYLATVISVLLHIIAIAPWRIKGARQWCSSSELRTSMCHEPPTDDADKHDDAMLMPMLMCMMATLMLTPMTSVGIVLKRARKRYAPRRWNGRRPMLSRWSGRKLRSQAHRRLIGQVADEDKSPGNPGQ